MFYVEISTTRNQNTNPHQAARYLTGVLLILLLFLAGCATRVPVGSYKTDGYWYTFKKGDTLKSIAKKHNISRLELQRINEIYDPDDLSEGIEIFIPRKKEKGEVATSQLPDSQQETQMIWPAAGTISSGFGKRHGNFHSGIDITRDNGREIKAAANGTVEFVGVKSGYGNTIILKHGSGLKTLYGHNAKIYAKRGQRIKQGDVIALMGSTGRSTGIHLHFEVRLKGKAQNPLRYLPIR